MIWPDIAGAPSCSRVALTALAAGVLALSSAGASSAKGDPVPVQFCGASRCVTFAKRDAGLPDFYRAAYGEVAPAQPLPTAFYRVHLLQRGRPWILGYYLPGRAMLSMQHTGGGFVRLPAQLTTFLAKGLRRVAPLPRPRIKELLVDGRRVRDVKLQTVLFASYPGSRLNSTAGRWIEIGIGWAAENPWSAEPPLAYHIRTRTLFRFGRALRLPPDLARRILAAAGRVGSAVRG